MASVHLCEQARFDLPLPLGWLLIIAVTAPNFLQAFVWFCPGAWKRAFRAAPADALATASRLLALLQCCTVLLWVWSSRPQGLCFDPSQISLLSWTTAVLTLTLGIALQRGVLDAVGTRGLYYGEKLEKQAVPSGASGWPFSLVPHPEYVGPALLIWSPVIMLARQLPPTSVFLATYWTNLLALSWFMEDYL